MAVPIKRGAEMGLYGTGEGGGYFANYIIHYIAAE